MATALRYSFFRASCFQVSPNPAHGQCTVLFTDLPPKHVRLFNIDGKLLQEIKPEDNAIEVHLSHSGIFILSVETDSGIFSKRIINW